MIKVCAGAALSRRHVWVEVYIRLPRARTLMTGWTWGLGRPYASVIDRPYRAVTDPL